jgi:antitoxin YefM
MYVFVYMKAITYTAARQNLAATMDSVCEDSSTVMITRTGKQQAVVMLSLEEYDQLEATAHLLRSPANAKRLLRAIEDLSKGRGKERKLARV